MATSFNTCLKRGCHVVYALEIEGIPFLFVEKHVRRVTAESNAASPGFIDGYGGATVAGLIIDGQKIGEEIDRKKGVSRARSLDFKLAYAPLEDAGVIDNLFQKPSFLSPVAADIDTGATSFTVTAVGGGWPNPAGIYVGNEYIYATGVAHSEPTTTFSSFTRGAWGPKYDHDAGGFTASRFATDRPNIWRGRMATLWECVVNQEGRALFDTWKTGDYCRQAWKGTLDASPVPGQVGFEFSAQALVRKLTQKIGFTGDWRIMWNELGHSFTEIVESPTADPNFQSWQGVTLGLYDPGDGSMAVDFHILLDDGTDESVTVSNSTARAYASVGHWAGDIAAGLVSQLSSDLENAKSYTSSSQAFFLFDVTDQASGTQLKSESTASVTGGTAPYFLRANQYAYPKYSTDIATVGGAETPMNHFRLETSWDWASYDVFPWLLVVNDQSSTLQDYTLPATGYAIAEADGEKELFKFANGADVAAYPGAKAIKVVQRAISGTPVNLAKYGVTIKVVAGTQGDLKSCALTMLESSGTATRGDFDTLGLGMGYAIDDGHISEADFGTSVAMYADRELVAADDGTVSFEGLFGGWYTMSGTCVAQRRNSSGVIQLRPVRHEVYALSARDPAVVSISASDILLKGVSPLEVVEAPNVVMVGTKSMANDAAYDVTVRSVPEIVREGVRAWDIKCPHMDAQDAYNAAQRAIVLGAGQYAITLTLGPWVDVQVGDPCILALGNHRGTFDFDDGTVGMTSAFARCMGVERDLETLEQKCRFLLYGNSIHPSLYCPTATVTAHSGAVVTLDTGEGAWFAATETVRLYNPGREELGTPEYSDIVINSISGDALTLASSAPAWVANNTTRATFPTYASASAGQRGFFFFKSDYRWN